MEESGLPSAEVAVDPETPETPETPAAPPAEPPDEAAADGRLQTGAHRLIAALPPLWGLPGPAATAVLIILAGLALLVGNEAVTLVVHVVSEGLGELGPVLLVSAVVAYLLDPLIDRFERRGWSRSPAILLCLTLFLAVDAVVLLFLVPYVVEEVAALSNNIDGYVAQVGAQLVRLQEFLGRTFGVEEELPFEDLANRLPELVALLPEGSLDPVKAAAQRVVGQTFGVLGFAVRWSLFPVFTFFLLRDFDVIKGGLFELVPHGWREPVLAHAVEIDAKMAEFVRGQFTVSCVLAVLYAAGLGLFTNIDMAVLIGVIAGLLFIIPYFGTFLGIVAGSLLAFLKFGISFEILKVWLVFGVAQGIEGTLLTPKIVGDSVGLHPMVVMLALFIGGGLFGFLGILLAVPVAAASLVLLRTAVLHYRTTSFFGAPPEPPPPDASP